MINRISCVGAMVLVSIAIGGCYGGLANREAIVLGAQQIAAGPDFAESTGDTETIDPRESYFTKGSFLVSMKDYVEKVGGKVDHDVFLWEIFTRYGDFVKSKIDYDAIPDMIAKGGSSKIEPNATRYDFIFVARDVTIGYDVSWFRGGPNDPDNPTPEVEVTYHIRVN
ncbi:MAG: hypothetical protein AMXMBFR84_32670 [Candidatus Hydrogenedentota bacterium]